MECDPKKFKKIDENWNVPLKFMKINKKWNVPKKIRSCAAMRHDDTFSFPPDHAAQHAQRSGPDERHKRDHFYTSEVSASSSVASGEKDDINCDACDWLRKHATPQCVRCG